MAAVGRTSDVEVSDEGSSTAGPQGRRQLLLGGGGLALGLLAAPGSSEAAAPTALPNRFASSEGFAFNFPAGWIVAFDRSGGQDNGAVTVRAEAPAGRLGAGGRAGMPPPSPLTPLV